MPNINRPIELLLIEDNIPDVELLKYLFMNTGSSFEFHYVLDGMEGSDFLFRRNKFAKSPVPDLVLLDLNIPKKDGREILKEVKTDKHLCRIPIIMLSTSSSYHEICEAYSLGATAFITKSHNLEDFQKSINSLVDFWFKTVDLPSRISNIS